MNPSLPHVRRLTQATLPWRMLLGLLIITVGVLALTPAPAVDLGLGWDKLNHTLAFAALAWCAVLGYRAPRALQWALLAGLLAFGGLIELLQQFVPNRSAEWGDLLADAIGIGIGAACAAVVLQLRREPALSRH
jgi:VanZ family protein